jgi:hypothetical protein
MQESRIKNKNLKSQEHLTVLLTELEIASEDHRLYVKNYHQQVNFLYIYASLLFAFFGYIKSSGIDFDKIMNSVGIERSAMEFIILIVICILALIAYYLIATSMNSLYMAFMQAARRGYIERLINKHFKRDLLIWDSKVVPRMYSVSFSGYKNWINPAYYLGFLLFTFLLGIHIILILICFYLINIYFPVVIGFAIIFLSFSLHQWMALQTSGKKIIADTVAEEAKIESDFMQFNKKINEFDGREDVNQKVYTIAPLITFISITVMMALSLSEKTFFPSKNVPFPYIFNFSVLIGDTFLMSFFNYLIFKFFITNWDFIKKIKAFIIISIIIFIVSSAAQFLIHFCIWSQEPYNSFLHIVKGELTFAGWWHLVYSALQTTSVFIFLSVLSCFSKYKLKSKSKELKKSIKSIDIGIKALYVFLIFSCIGILDFISKKLSVQSDVPFWISIFPNEIITLLKISFTLIFIWFFTRKRNEFITK